MSDLEMRRIEILDEFIKLGKEKYNKKETKISQEDQVKIKLLSADLGSRTLTFEFVK